MYFSLAQVGLAHRKEAVGLLFSEFWAFPALKGISAYTGCPS